MKRDTGTAVSRVLAITLVSISIISLIQPALAAQFYPSNYSMFGSTTLFSGTVPNVGANDGVYMVFNAYPTSAFGTNLISNSGFELNTAWTEASIPTKKAVTQDISTSYSGTYSGLTDTSSPPVGRSFARLNQTLAPTSVSLIPNEQDMFVFHLRIGQSGKTGYDSVFVNVSSSQGHTIHYIFRLNASALPADTGSDKFIDLGTSLGVASWTTVGRNFYQDWVVTKGFPSTDTINSIVLQSFGVKQGEREYGQLVNWDNIVLLKTGQYVAEVEFTGASSAASTAVTWSIDSAWTVPGASVTMQLYNYNSGSYPTTGDGYISYTSSSTPSTDETKTGVITVNPANFRDLSGNWKIKIKGAMQTTSAFQLKVDLVSYMNAQAVYTVGLQDSSAITESASKAPNLVRSIDELIPIDDIMERSSSLVLRISETLSILDTMAFDKLSGPISSFYREVSDAVSISEQASRGASFIRGIFDSASVQVTISKIDQLLEAIRNPGSGGGPGSVIRAASMNFQIMLYETLKITDEINRKAIMTAQLEDIISVIANVRVPSFLVHIGDQISFPETIGRIESAFRSIVEKVTITTDKFNGQAMVRGPFDLSVSLGDIISSIAKRAIIPQADIRTSILVTNFGERTAAIMVKYWITNQNGIDVLSDTKSIELEPNQTITLPLGVTVYAPGDYVVNSQIAFVIQPGLAARSYPITFWDVYGFLILVIIFTAAIIGTLWYIGKKRKKSKKGSISLMGTQRSNPSGGLVASIQG